jgi:hypothetical protein
MPYSSHLGLSLALEQAVRVRPRRVLDVGVGFGKWGYLLREALDFIDGRVERDEWQARIDGIDARSYDAPLAAWVYDDVRIADVLDAAGDIEGYDLVVLGDVIEHFEKADGLALLRALLARNRNVLVVTPFFYFGQEVEGNPYQRHRSHWTIDDFRPWVFDYDVAGGAVVVVLLAGRDAVEPRSADVRASRVAYGVPFLRRRGAAARVVKSLVRRFA